MLGAHDASRLAFGTCICQDTHVVCLLSLIGSGCQWRGRWPIHGLAADMDMEVRVVSGCTCRKPAAARSMLPSICLSWVATASGCMGLSLHSRHPSHPLTCACTNWLQLMLGAQAHCCAYVHMCTPSQNAVALCSLALWEGILSYNAEKQLAQAIYRVHWQRPAMQGAAHVTAARAMLTGGPRAPCSPNIPTPQTS